MPTPFTQEIAGSNPAGGTATAFRDGVADEMLVLEQIARQAGFSGSMRKNMVKMLDMIGLPPALGIETSAELFRVRDHLLHGTSALRYPVLVDGKNHLGANGQLHDVRSLFGFRILPGLMVIASFSFTAMR